MDHQKRLLVESALIPVFYKEFHCLAKKCRDSCCVGWKIHFDKKDYLRLRRLEASEELKERLTQGVRRIRGESADKEMYGHFDLENNGDRCPFLAEDGLCDIQRECGHEALPHVCTSYPRRIVYSPAAKEYSLSPSCEGVLERLWEAPDGVKFIEEPLPKTEQRAMKESDQGNLMRHYASIHRTVIGILQNRALSLAERMLYLGITIQRLQREDWTGFDPGSWGSQTLALMDSGMMKETLGKITGNRMLYIMQNLKVLGLISRAKKEPWIEEIFEALEVEQKIAMMAAESGDKEQEPHFLMDFPPENYDQALEEFEKAFSGQEYFFENLMIASSLQLDFPVLTSREELWKSYVSLCNLYSFYHFVAVLGCKGQGTKERLFHMIVMSSRATLHNRGRFQTFREELFQNDSSTLAHMAILLKG